MLENCPSESIPRSGDSASNERSSLDLLRRGDGFLFSLLSILNDIEVGLTTDSFDDLSAFRISSILDRFIEDEEHL